MSDEIRRIAAHLVSHANTLHKLDARRVAAALADAARRIADPNSDLGIEARALLPGTTGLTAPMVGWALETTLGNLDVNGLLGLAARMLPRTPREHAVPLRLVVAVLAGNVFTAAVRAIFLPLLARAPVVAKASMREDLMPRLLVRAIAERDPVIGEAAHVVTFAGGTVALEDALFAQADAVAAYGGDATLAEIRSRLPSTCTFIGHGHGLGVGFVPAAALGSEDEARLCARRLALDVAAYDQRGCLSPHAIWVERGGTVGGRGFAVALHDALGAVAVDLPRGALPVEVGAAQVQWRGVAAARGELFEGDGWAVSWEGDAPLRLSPGWRNVSVLECAGAADFGRRASSLGVHLKVVGVAGPDAGRLQLARSLPRPLAPRLCAAGTMQTPPIDALADGEDPFTGLVRWIEVS